jgi:hypothetical protein
MHRTETESLWPNQLRVLCLFTQLLSVNSNGQKLLRVRPKWILHRIVTLGPPPKRTGGGPSGLDAKDRTRAHCIKQVRYRIGSEGKLNWPQPKQNSRCRESDETRKQRTDRQTEYIVPTNNTVREVTQRFRGVRESPELVFVPVASTPAARPIRCQYSPIRSGAFAMLASGSHELCSSP